MSPEWDGKSPRIRTGELSPDSGEQSHRYRFGQHPVMPWKMVECPKCKGKTFIVIVEWDEDGDGKPESDMVARCDICEGEGEITEFRRRQWAKEQAGDR